MHSMYEALAREHQRELHDRARQERLARSVRRVDASAHQRHRPVLRRRAGHR